MFFSSHGTQLYNLALLHHPVSVSDQELGGGKAGNKLPNYARVCYGEPNQLTDAHFW